MSDDNNKTQNNEFTLEKIIKFYMSKQEHYPISDKFMMNYRQESDAYIKAFSTFDSNGKRGDENDKHFYELLSCFVEDKYHDSWKEKKKVDNKDQLKKNLVLLKNMNKEEIFCHNGQENYKGLEPNQKWHFLISWFAYKQLAKKEQGRNIFFDDFQKNGKYIIAVIPFADKAIKTTPKAWIGLNCLELKLWLYEAAYDGCNITMEKIKKLYSEAVNCQLNEERVDKKFWGNCWDDIVKVITKWQG